MTIDDFFAGFETSRPIFEALQAAIIALGPSEVRVSKSQIAFRRRRPFAWVWLPDRYLGAGHAPLVLTLSFARPDPSPRWKQIVEPTPGRFTHHLELYASSDIDDQVHQWLRLVWAAAA